MDSYIYSENYISDYSGNYNSCNNYIDYNRITAEMYLKDNPELKNFLKTENITMKLYLRITFKTYKNHGIIPCCPWIRNAMEQLNKQYKNKNLIL